MNIMQIVITQIAITQQWHTLAKLTWLSLDTGRHRRLRGPIFQLPPPAAKGSPWPLPRPWGRRNDGGRGKKQRGQRPSPHVLTTVATPTLTALTCTIPLKDDPFITNTAALEISQLSTCWFRSDSFCQDHHIPRPSDGIQGEWEGRLETH